MANKFFEYALLGIPSINSDFPDYKEKLDEFEVGISVNPKNTKSIEEGIQELLNNRTYYVDECKNASLVWNWEAQEYRLTEWIDTICK